MFDFGFVRDNWLYIAAGVGETLGIALASFLLAWPIGVVVAKGRRSPMLALEALSRFYAWLVDGIPLLLQIFFIYLALPRVGIYLTGLAGAVLVLTVNYGARLSHIFYERRAALVPALTRELGGIVKDTTLFSVAGFIHDVFWRAQRIGRAEFKPLEALTVAALIYLILYALVTLGGKALEARWRGPEPGTDAAA